MKMSRVGARVGRMVELAYIQLIMWKFNEEWLMEDTMGTGRGGAKLTLPMFSFQPFSSYPSVPSQMLCMEIIQNFLGSSSREWTCATSGRQMIMTMIHSK